jgi:hypothetical protein
MATHTVVQTWEKRPGVWFSLLCQALAEHNFEAAAEANKNLHRLGVEVRFRDLEQANGPAQCARGEVRCAE